MQTSSWGLCVCVCVFRWHKEGERIVSFLLSVFNLKEIYETTDDSLHNQFWSLFFSKDHKADVILNADEARSLKAYGKLPEYGS